MGKIKVAVSSTGKDVQSEVSDVFGRCQYFIIAEIENKKIVKTECIENTSANQIGGAGIYAAKTVAEKGAEVVITGNIGPRASAVLKQFNIEVYGKGKCKSVEEALREFINGKLERIV